MTTTGQFKAQTLRGRLQAKQHGISRIEFFRGKFLDENWDALAVEWFITFDAVNKTLPGKAEGELLQAYWDAHGCLPPWNAGY